MFYRAVCYGCTAASGTIAVYLLTHGQTVPAALLATVALWNYYIGGKKK